MGRRGTAAKPLPSKLAALLPALLLAALLAACNGEAPPEEAKQEETSNPEAAGTPQKPSLLLEPVAFAELPGWAENSEERRVGKGWVSTCRFRCVAVRETKKQNN